MYQANVRMNENLDVSPFYITLSGRSWNNNSFPGTKYFRKRWVCYINYLKNTRFCGAWFDPDVLNVSPNDMMEVTESKEVQVHPSAVITYGIVPGNLEVVQYVHSTPRHTDIPRGEHLNMFTGDIRGSMRHHSVKMPHSSEFFVACPASQSVFKVGKTINILTTKPVHYVPVLGEIMELLPESHQRSRFGEFLPSTGMYSTHIGVYSMPGISPLVHYNVRFNHKDWDLVTCPHHAGIFVVRRIEEEDEEE